jgi:hypothetical protein
MREIRELTPDGEVKVVEDDDWDRGQKIWDRSKDTSYASTWKKEDVGVRGSVQVPR